MQQVTLVTQHLTMRAFDRGDAEALLEACQDPEIVKWTGTPQPFSLGDATQLIEQRYPQSWSSDEAYTFGAFRRDDGNLVSSVTLIRERFSVFEIAYWTTPAQRGKRLTVEGVRRAVDWAFDELDAERVEWQGIVGNDASWAVARSLGFQPEGVLRGRVAQRGTRRDTRIAGLLRSGRSSAAVREERAER
jgi:RimJ/RimL family protein N-acetyltransferase